jgi:hypothetical protein
MKRINPDTGKLFQTGDARKDGAIFEKYTKRLNKNGFFIEQFNNSGRGDGKKRINTDTGLPYKHGDKDSKGNMFRGYDYKRIREDGTFMELWIKESTLKKRLEIQRKAVKRINPITKKVFVVGDTRKEDNKIFLCYREKSTEKGYKVEDWWSPKIYQEKRIEANYRRHKNRCQKTGVRFEITIDYLKEIYPKDNRCPALGIKMYWGGDYGRNSPSLDKIIPNKGYVKGNVAWISFKANAIKNNANSDEIMKVAKWLKKQKKI